MTTTILIVARAADQATPFQALQYRRQVAADRLTQRANWLAVN